MRQKTGRYQRRVEHSDAPSSERPAVSGKNRYTMGMMNAFRAAKTGTRVRPVTHMEAQRTDIRPPRDIVERRPGDHHDHEIEDPIGR